MNKQKIIIKIIDRIKYCGNTKAITVCKENNIRKRLNSWRIVSFSGSNSGMQIKLISILIIIEIISNIKLPVFQKIKKRSGKMFSPSKYCGIIIT